MNAAASKMNEPGDDGPHARPPDWPCDDDAADDAGDDSCDEGLALALASPPDLAAPSGVSGVSGALGDARQAATNVQLGQWIEAIARQDERALAALYDATIGRVFGLVQRIVRNTAMAEEVVEDAYFQVWRQAVRFDPARGKALTWLLSMARSRAIDALRREARFAHDTLDDEAAPAIACECAPADELLDLARHCSDLQHALTLLGAQPRQLVSLAFLRGLSHEEIAEQTQLPLGTVKSQIRRALLSLRQILGNGGGAPTLAS